MPSQSKLKKAWLPRLFQINFWALCLLFVVYLVLVLYNLLANGQFLFDGISLATRGFRLPTLNSEALENLELWQLGLGHLLFLPSLVLSIVIAFQLWKITQAAESLEVFSQEILTRITRLGQIWIVLGFLGEFMATYSAWLYHEASGPDTLDMTITWNLPISEIFMGLTIIFLARIIRSGLVLKEEQEMTV